MQLVDAVMLGSTTGHKLSNGSWQTCLVGMGVAALVHTSDARKEAVTRWPWLLREFSDAEIPTCIAYLRGVLMFKIDGLQLVTSLCNEVMEKTITLEQADGMEYYNQPGFCGIVARAKEVLGLTDVEANHLFYYDEWPVKFAQDFCTAKSQSAQAKIAAKRIQHLIKTGE